MSALPVIPPADVPAVVQAASRGTGPAALPDCDAGLLSCSPGRLCSCGRRAVPAAGEAG